MASRPIEQIYQVLPPIGHAPAIAANQAFKRMKEAHAQVAVKTIKSRFRVRWGRFRQPESGMIVP